MTRIFISYRRSDDAGSVGRVRDRLRDAYGEDAVFRDIDGIPKGTRFSEVISEELARCNVLLVVIGPHWLDATDADGNRRLDHPEDWVRTEVELGLARSDLRVVPVLVGGATLPARDQLPASIQELLAWNAAWLADDSFDHDFDVLVRDLGGRRGLARFAPALAAAVLVVGLAAGFALLRSDGGGDAPAETAAALGGAGTTTTVPELMKGTYNIAVAEFTARSPADQTDASALSARAVETLTEELGVDPALGVEIRQLGALSGDTAAERREAADQIAGEIGADVVIDAEVDFADPSTIASDVLLRPSGIGGNPELLGHYEVPVSYPGSSANPQTKALLAKRFADATEAVAQFLRGVSNFDLVDAEVRAGEDDPRAVARAAFTAALESPDVPAVIQEGSHAFLGSLALLGNDLAEAERRFMAAIDINPDSTRGRLGLAEVHLRRSSGVRCADDVDGAGLTLAAAEFAAVAPTDVDPAAVAVKATLGEARALRCRSQAALSDDFDLAAEMLTEVIAVGGDDPELRELVAAAHGELALVVAPPTGAAPDADALEAALAESALAADTTDRAQNEAVFRWQEAFYLQQLGRSDDAAAALAKAAALEEAFGSLAVDDLAPQAPPAARLVPRGTYGSFALPDVVLAFTGQESVGLISLALVLLVVGFGLLSAASRLRRRRCLGG